MVALPYPPNAHPTQREYAPALYSVAQEAGWQAINEAYFAWVEGRTENYVPDYPINMPKFLAWKEKALKAWQTENASRGKGITRSIEDEDFPENLWMWLYTRLRQAKEVA